MSLSCYMFRQDGDNPEHMKSEGFKQDFYCRKAVMKVFFALKKHVL